jgi:hypothetical protein
MVDYECTVYINYSITQVSSREMYVLVVQSILGRKRSGSGSISTSHLHCQTNLKADPTSVCTNAHEGYSHKGMNWERLHRKNNSWPCQV